MAKPAKLSKETHNHFPLWQQSSGKRQLFLAIAAIAIGIAGAYGAIGFLLLIDTIQLLVYGAPSEIVYQRARELEWWHRLVAPALGGVIIGIFIHYFLRDRRPHGVADVMQATISRDGNIEMRNGIAAAAVSAASIGVGASVGREGPVVHLLSSVASSSSRLFKLDKTTKITLIGCGAASAIAASFNAPIAGAFFALEVIIGHYGLGALVGAVFGLLIAPLFPEMEINPAAYSVVAMGAVAGAVLGAPISTFLMISELTRNFNLTIAVMLSTVLSSLIIRQTVGYSFFAWQLKDRGLDVTKLPSAYVRKSSGIPPNLIKPAPILYKGSTETISPPINRPDSEFFITDQSGILRGLITKDNISRRLAEDTNNDQNLKPSETIGPSSVLIKETTLEDALNLFEISGLSCLPVVESVESMRLVGVLYYKDALLTYNHDMIAVNQQAYLFTFLKNVWRTPCHRFKIQL